MELIDYKNMFAKKEKITITISELYLFLSCPRKLYFHSRENETLSFSPFFIDHLLLKEMAMAYPHMLKSYSSKDDVTIHELESLLLQSMDDIVLIYPAELMGAEEETITASMDRIRGFFDVIGQNLSEQLKMPEIVSLATKLSGLDKEPFLFSEKMNVSGVLYRLLHTDDTFVPVLLKTGKFPEKGLWRNDRLHLTSFAMLAEEMYGVHVSYGFVLYAKAGLFRRSSILPNHRREVLRTIGRARKVKEGNMPARKEGPLCSSCTYSGMCNVKVSFASKFF